MYWISFSQWLIFILTCLKTALGHTDIICRWLVKRLTNDYKNSPVSQSFFPSCEQPEQRILAHKSKQPTAICIAIFHKYCCHSKHGGSITNLTQWNPWSMLLIFQDTTMRVYGAWIRIYYVLCPKTHLAVCSGLPLVCGKPIGAPAFVRRAYCVVCLVLTTRHWKPIQIILTIQILRAKLH